MRKKEKQINWLAFWISLAIINLFEPVIDVLLSWIPFFNLLKTLKIDENLSNLREKGLVYAFNYFELVLVHMSKLVMGYYVKSTQSNAKNGASNENKTESLDNSKMPAESNSLFNLEYLVNDESVKKLSKTADKINNKLHRKLSVN
ncbi:MAG: hypothetical protein MHPSP_000183, partial [Paramarteilia canceri]